ncbi:MAG: sugar phosphate isomerase/epimerase family protein [Verrucomicrobiota bacterium]
MKGSFLNRLAVCSWSLQPANPQQLVQALQEIGLSKIQLALDPIREHSTTWASFEKDAERAGLECVSGMMGCAGEDYTTMESIRRTGGIVPDATWRQNWTNIQATAELAARMGLRLVTFHAGFLPHDPKDPGYAKLLQRLIQVADCFNQKGIDLALETGQETADALRAFLQQLDRPGVGVNFDPANMILYDKGDPIQALRTLSPWLKQCHIKDARKTKTAGTWGDEVPAGTGEVPWKEFFKVLQEQNYGGYCSIEREAGQQRVQDIRAARQMVESLGV